MNDNIVQLPGTVRKDQGPRPFVPPPLDWAAKRRRGLETLRAMRGNERHKLQALTDETLRKLGPDATRNILNDCLAFVRAMTPDEPA